MGDDSGFQIQQVAAEAYARETAVFMQPLVDVLLDVAGVASGDHVLDVACGTGLAARSAARVVGSSGRVSGADVNAAMIAVAQRGQATVPEISWHVAGADDMPFDDATFDVVLAQQGIQFFPDLPRAVREMARVARPGGSVSATTWTAVEDSPVLHAQYAALTELVPGDAATTFPAAFRLTGPELVAAWTAAGLVDVETEAVAPLVTLPAYGEHVLAHITATPWGADVLAQPPDAQQAFVARVRDLLATYTRDDGAVVAPFSTWVVTGRVPSTR